MLKENSLKVLFNELLDRWYWAEDSCINSMSTDLDHDYSELEKDKELYKKIFLEVLHG